MRLGITCLLLIIEDKGQYTFFWDFCESAIGYSILEKQLFTRIYFTIKSVVVLSK